MELIPAIDLVHGRVVRLEQGDFARATDHGGDPLGVARRWADAGAGRLHLVDLDGARSGRPVQRDLITAIVTALPGVRCQAAGGLRDDAAVAAALATGVDRAVLGTALLARPSPAERLVSRFGAARIVAALDVRNGQAVGEGWRDGAPGTPLPEAIDALLGAGIVTFALTAIARDGSLGGPDLALYREARAAAPAARLIASGGITTIDDLRALAVLGVDAAILGRCLYEGRIDLGEAMVAVG